MMAIWGDIGYESGTISWETMMVEPEMTDRDYKFSRWVLKVGELCFSMVEWLNMKTCKTVADLF